MKKSRLSKRLEKKTKKNLILFVLGIIIIFVILVRYGIPLMANVALFISNTKSSQDIQEKTISYVSPPVLNPLLEATNSAQMIISGIASKGSDIELYVNDELKDKIKADENGNFQFSYSLSKGDNNIKARSVINDKNSDFSDTMTVTYKDIVPALSIDVPADGQKFIKDQSTVNVSGKTDQGNSVTVDGFIAIINENGTYSYDLPLKNGDNKITVVSTDQAGNKEEKSITVNYSQ